MNNAQVLTLVGYDISCILRWNKLYKYNQMKRVILSTAALCLVFSACKKSDNGSNGGSRTSTLTNGKWRMTSSTAVIEYPAPIGTQNTDVMKSMSSCQTDNLYIFNTDGTGTTDEGATKCSTSDPQTFASGTWAFINNESQLKVTDKGMTITSDVMSFDNSAMTLKTVTNFNNIKTTQTTSYSHQ
jgi:hypothetical protein